MSADELAKQLRLAERVHARIITSDRLAPGYAMRVYQSNLRLGQLRLIGWQFISKGELNEDSQVHPE